VRTFHLNRIDDETGVSGTGRVVEGIEFSDGAVVTRWMTEKTSYGFYKSIDDVIAIHGHGGRTVVEWT
jgi:hypothetical protein